MNNQAENLIIEKGQTIGDFVCYSHLVLQDIVLVWNSEGASRCYHLSGFNKSPRLYTINEEQVSKILIPKDHEILVIHTASQVYYRNFRNQELEGSKDWVDYYLEALNNEFYRKDVHGNWYNLEGNKMDKPVFLQENVLVSLNGKSSMRSLVFRKEDLVCSPNFDLIQVGKLVYNKELKLANYLGERITEIGSRNIQFSEGDNLQEVKIGVNRVGFINEQNQEVCQIDGCEIIDYAGDVDFFSKYSFKIFKSKKKSFFLGNSSKDVFCIEDKPVVLQSDSFQKFGPFELVGVEDSGNSYYIDINTKQPFRLPEFETDLIQWISQMPITIGSELVYSIKTNKREIAYNLTTQSVFSIQGGSALPNIIEFVEGFESYFFYATFEGVRKLCYVKDCSIVKLGEFDLEVGKIVGNNTDLLLNVVGVNEERFVMDVRHGYDQIKIATCDGKRIVEVKGASVKVSNYVLQKVDLLNIGGLENAIINLNVENLDLFRLPEDMTAYPDQEEKSIFCGNVVNDVDFDNLMDIGGNGFYQGAFVNYLGQTNTVIFSSNTGRPLQLLSLGARLEMVTSFDEATSLTRYQLGANRIMGAFTLSEDMKEMELLFSVEQMSSWIPFYDTHLPIFRKIVEIDGLEDWEYLLFESREGTNEKEYVAVEKASPYRILAEKKNGKQQIKIIKGENIALRTPERVSVIKQFFNMDPGYLVELD